MTTTCSASSLLASEPMEGSACARTLHWIGLEYPRPWRPKGVTDTDLPGPAAAWLGAQASAPSTRPLLLRQRGRRGKALIYANLDLGRVHRFELGRYNEILDLPWADLRAGRTDEGLAPLSPLFVCTHSARDHCCGLHGAGVARALCALAGDRVWQCSHLGGHRFAATIVALPQGIHFGRVRQEHASELLNCLDSGRISDLDLVRGQVRLSPAEQAACLYLRRESGDLELGAFDQVVSHETSESTTVTLRHRGQQHSLRVQRVELGRSAPPSCGASPAPLRRYVVTMVE